MKKYLYLSVALLLAQRVYGEEPQMQMAAPEEVAEVIEIQPGQPEQMVAEEPMQTTDLWTKLKEATYAQPKDVVQNVSTRVSPEARRTVGDSGVPGQAVQENSRPFA